MSALRLLGIHALIVLVIGGHLFCIVDEHDFWPLSRYPMYAKQQGPVHSLYKLYGVDGEERHRLRIAEHLAPFDPPRLLRSLHRLRKHRRLKKAGPWLLERYDQLRREGAHEGPPVEELVVIQERYRLTEGEQGLREPFRRRRLFRVRARARGADR